MEYKEGLFNPQENTPLMIDPNYITVFTLASQEGLRVARISVGRSNH